VQAPDWIEFPAAAQIIQLRRTRTIKGRKTIEVVYAICSLDMIAAPLATGGQQLGGWHAVTGEVTVHMGRWGVARAPSVHHEDLSAGPGKHQGCG
jgi:hypothetical protein